MERRHYFSHTSRDGSDFVQRIRRTGYFKRASTWFVGENLAWGAGPNRSSPRGIVAAWMNSPPHRQNILNSRFREIGIGVVVGAPGGTCSACRPPPTPPASAPAAEPSSAARVSRRLAPDSRGP